MGARELYKERWFISSRVVTTHKFRRSTLERSLTALLCVDLSCGFLRAISLRFFAARQRWLSLLQLVLIRVQMQGLSCSDVYLLIEFGASLVAHFNVVAAGLQMHGLQLSYGPGVHAVDVQFGILSCVWNFRAPVCGALS